MSFCGWLSFDGIGIPAFNAFFDSFITNVFFVDRRLPVFRQAAIGGSLQSTSFALVVAVAGRPSKRMVFTRECSRGDGRVLQRGSVGLDALIIKPSKLDNSVLGCKIVRVSRTFLKANSVKFPTI